MFANYIDNTTNIRYTNNMQKVVFSNNVVKQLPKIPKPIVLKAFSWVKEVETKGLQEIRLIKGKHDEPLQGKRKGQRSVRLNKQWRLIYSEIDCTVIEIQEITPHDYRTR
jgi:proteic killer suppression protein